MTKFIYALIAAVAMGVSAQISIPLPQEIAVAPITAQTLAVLVAAHLLKWKWAGISILLYLALGSLGLPFFSDFSGGWEVASGPSLGYFIGFVLGGILVGKLAEKQPNKFIYNMGQLTYGSIVILICGIIGLLRYMDFNEALTKGVLPFLPGALTKVVLGAILLSIIARFNRLMNQEELRKK